jgi:CheY-like chemotaxis protein
MSKFYRIILVDDDEVDNYLHKHLIEDLGVAQQVSICKDGNEALNYIRSLIQEEAPETVTPELILLDINMPIMDGFQFLEEVQTFNRKSFLIVILSSSNHMMDIQKAAEHKVDYFITKPLTIEKFKKMLERVV